MKTLTNNWLFMLAIAVATAVLFLLAFQVFPQIRARIWFDENRDFFECVCAATGTPIGDPAVDYVAKGRDLAVREGAC